jgi:hypothetical protein
MNMKLRMILATAAISTVTVFSGTALAATPSKVTIKGTDGDYYGKVKSADSDCLADRSVVVYEQLGSSPSPKTDMQIGSDTTGTDGAWSIGNSGYKDGSFYAKVKKSSECRGALSKVIDR